VTEWLAFSDPVSSGGKTIERGANDERK
jgi:hypothetical protein